MPRFSKPFLKNNRGQILVEYMLLMVIAVGIATFLTKAFIGRGEDANRGMIIKQWDKIITILGNDLPDCAKQTDFGTANCPQ